MLVRVRTKFRRLQNWVAASAGLAILSTGLREAVDHFDALSFAQDDGSWSSLSARLGISFFAILAAILAVGASRILHDLALPSGQDLPLDESLRPLDDRMVLAHDLLDSVPRFVGLLKSQLEETNRIGGEFAISILTQISSVQHEASQLLDTLTDVRSRAAEMCDNAQALIGSSRQKLTEMDRYTHLRENEIRDDSDAIHRVVTLMEELLPLTGLIGMLSKQTRLLALNAAIQAANDQSVDRGFVAVAEEMRKLATEINSTSQQVDAVMRQVTRIVEEKLQDMVSPHRIETERNWLHTLTDSTTRMSAQFEEAVFGLDRMTRESHDTVRLIFSAVLKTHETAQLQDITRQQIELVQHGLDLLGTRLGSTAEAFEPDADRPSEIKPLDDLVLDLEARYSMQIQQSVHDRTLFEKSNAAGGREPIVELF